MHRRAFLKYVSVGTVLGMLPNPVGGRAYAQSEKTKWSALTARDPTGKFGKIGAPVTLTVGYQPYCTPYWTATVNKQSKLWLKHLPRGSQVVWFRARSGPLITNNLLAGKNQVGYLAEASAFEAGVVVALTGYDLGETGSLCVRDDLLKEGKVKNAKDLEGRAIGVTFGTFSYRQVLTWADQQQVKLRLVNRSIEKQRSDLKTNQIWAGVLWEPYSQWLEQKGIAMRWLTGQEMPCTCKKDHTFRVVGMTLAIHEWLRERPDILVAYLEAEEECRDMLMHNPNLAAYHIWSDIPEVPPAIIRASLDMMVWDGRITAEVKQHLRGCARLWQQQGFLKQVRSADLDKYVEEWVDDRYLRYAMTERQSQGWWTSETLPGFPKAVRPDQLARHHWKSYEGLSLQEQAWQPTHWGFPTHK